MCVTPKARLAKQTQRGGRPNKYMDGGTVVVPSETAATFVDPGDASKERRQKPQRARANSPRGRLGQNRAPQDAGKRWVGAPLISPMDGGRQGQCSSTEVVASTHSDDYTDPATRLRKGGDLAIRGQDKGWIKPEVGLGSSVGDILFGHGEVGEAGWDRASYTPRIEQGYRPQSQALFRQLTEGAAGKTMVRRTDNWARGEVVHAHAQARSPGGELMPWPRPDGLAPGPVVDHDANDLRLFEHTDLTSRLRHEREAREQDVPLLVAVAPPAGVGELGSGGGRRVSPVHLRTPEERSHEPRKGSGCAMSVAVCRPRCHERRTNPHPAA